MLALISESGITVICMNILIYILSEHKIKSKSQNKMNQFSEAFATGSN